MASWEWNSQICIGGEATSLDRLKPTLRSIAKGLGSLEDVIANGLSGLQFTLDWIDKGLDRLYSLVVELQSLNRLKPALDSDFVGWSRPEYLLSTALDYLVYL